MLSLSTEQIRSGLARCLDRPEAAITDLRRLTNGWESEVIGFSVDGEPRILRYGPVGPKDGSVEVRVMQHLHRARFPVPRVYAHGVASAEFGGAFLVMDFVPGVPMWKRYMDGSGNLNPALVIDFAGLMVRLHRVDPEPLKGVPSTFSTDLLHHLAHSHGLSGAFAPAFAWLSEREPGVDRQPRSVIHGDFHVDNILADGEKEPVVIDWTAATVDDPRADLGWTMVLVLAGRDPARAEALARAYEAVSGEPLREIDFFVNLGLIRRLLVLTIAVAAGAGAIGMRPGFEEQLKQDGTYLRRLLGMTEERTGFGLPDVRVVLEQHCR